MYSRECADVCRQVDVREHSMQTIAANVEEQHCSPKIYTLAALNMLNNSNRPTAKTQATLCANGELKRFPVKANRSGDPRTNICKTEFCVFWQKSSRLTLSGALTLLKSGSPACCRTTGKLCTITYKHEHIAIDPNLNYTAGSYITNDVAKPV